MISYKLLYSDRLFLLSLFGKQEVRTQASKGAG